MPSFRYPMPPHLADHIGRERRYIPQDRLLTKGLRQAFGDYFDSHHLEPTLGDLPMSGSEFG